MRASFAQIVFAPWRHALAPRRAGRILAEAGPVAVLVSFALGILVTGAQLGWHLLSYERLREVRLPDPTTSYGYRFEIETRTPLEVFADMRAGDYPLAGPMGVLFWSCLLTTAVVVGSVVQWPNVYSGGSWARSLRRTAAALTGVLGPASMLMIGWSWVTVSLHHMRLRIWAQGTNPFLMPWFYLPSAILFMASAVLLLWWMGQAVRGAREDDDREPTEPEPASGGMLCEACGYDLTHVAESGRCTECGTDLALSLTPGAPRGGAAWEEGRGLAHLLGTIRQIIFDPERFYGSLRLRTPDQRARRFAVIQYLAIGLGAWPWMVTMALLQPGAGRELAVPVLVPVLLAGAAALLGWLVHRVTAALALNYCFLKGVLPRPAYARKILAYEAAVLWVFCAYDGVLMTAIFCLDRSLGQFLTRTNVLGMPLSILLAVGGNGVIALLWLSRYRRVVQRVRWANF